MEYAMKPKTIIGWLEAVAAEHESKTAVTFLRNGGPETEITYGRLLLDVNRFANFLMELGVKKGDRVMLFIPKSLIALVAHFALHRIGAMAVPLNPGFKKSELEYLLGDASASLIITEPGKTSLLREIDTQVQLLEIETGRSYQDIDVFRSASDGAPDVQITPDDPGLIVYTSGTTGNPKGTMLTNANLVHDARNVIHIWEFTASDVLCHALPLFHVHGLCFAMHTALLSGAQMRMLDQFSPEVVISELSRNTGDAVCTVFMAVPAMYTKLMDVLGDTKLDFGHMRLFTSGSAPLLVKELESIVSVFGREPVEREGMTETGMNFSNPLTGRRIPGSIGLPLPGVQVRIVDAERCSDVAPGEIGELWLKSAAITLGYWGKPEETAETFKDGWFRTGDLGKIDDAGYYYLTDRIKHIIISGGENVSAKEVETVINQIDGVDESVVVGKPDEKWGEKVVAAVTLKSDAEIAEDDVRAYCKEHLHDWKCPKEIMFLNEIPRNTMGKMLKEEVKKMFLSGNES